MTIGGDRPATLVATDVNSSIKMPKEPIIQVSDTTKMQCPKDSFGEILLLAPNLFIALPLIFIKIKNIKDPDTYFSGIA